MNVEQLKRDLLEAQDKRAQHWRKLQLTKLTEQCLRSFAMKNIEEELYFSNTMSFIVKCMLKFNSEKKLRVEETIFLFLSVYSDYLEKKYKLSSEDDVIPLIVNKITEHKIQRAVLTKILKNSLLKKRQKKFIDRLDELKIFILKEKDALLLKKKDLENVDSYAYKLFLETEAAEVKKQKNIVKKEFILKETKKVKVAVILDEFSFNCFKDEFDAVTITPQNWKEKFIKEQPEIFFCESAWSGADSIERPWKGKIYSSINWKHENRKDLLEILKFCKENEIPTIFWNKEDPSHYTDRVHDFVKTAILFDHVFTTAEECIESYKTEYGIKNVYVLPFATSPKMFNPIETIERKNNIIFAGSWYANHIERSKDMENILDVILKSHELKIVDRYYGTDDELHIYPERYNKYISPGIPFTQMPKLYKESNMALTFNTVKNSNTMFARRAFELMSSNTLVLSNNSIGMHNLLNGLFVDIEKNPGELNKLNQKDIDCIKSRALDFVLKNHTYRHRWSYILESINYKTLQDSNTITVVIIVSSEEEIKKIINKVNNLEEIAKLLIVLDNSFNSSNMQNLILKYNKGLVSLVSKNYIDSYGSDVNFIQTSHFFLMDYSGVENIKLSQKLLAHSYYLNNNYMVLDNEFKYKFKKGFLVKEVFSIKDNFLNLLNSYNTYIDEEVYCLDDNFWNETK